MVQLIEAERVPLRMDETGSIRVGNTRVLLELVVSEHNTGMAPEQIVETYPTLELADVYDVIAYYLRHRPEIDGYIEERQVEAQQLREKIEAGQDLSWIRDRVKAHPSQSDTMNDKPAS
ncbi:MAG: DUF433 domain-containing protein [Chloroflexota bacterium]|nr:DUF433 domain-containing protein [Chloroflexota bacterium]